MLAIVETLRDLREFISAKKRKREPIRWDVRGTSSAAYVPRDHRGFTNFRAALRGVGDWGQASERVDSLADALRRKHACELPLPRKVFQNHDRSLTFLWESITVRVYTDRFTAMIGGVKGKPVTNVTPEILDMLGFLAKVQNA